MPPAQPFELRLLAKIDRLYGDPPEHKPELGPCWPWMGGLNSDGYGKLRGNGPKVLEADGKRRSPLVLAHRAVLELALKRPLRPGLFANHRCDNRRCCRPAHLYEGTPTENVRDMILAGRIGGAIHAYGKQEVAIALRMLDREEDDWHGQATI